MALELFLRPTRDTVSVLEGLDCKAGLRNKTGAALADIPRPELDGTSAFTIDVFEPSREAFGPLRRMSATTQQIMLTMGRPTHDPVNGTLADGEHWMWQFDTATLHYTLPVGAHVLRAALAAGPGAASPPVAVTVQAEQIVSVQVVRDNPILPGVALLIGARSGGGVRYFLRQHNAIVPLAAWYSKQIIDDSAVTEAVIAAPNYVRRENFEPAFRKWVVTRSGERIDAACFRFGLPFGERRTAAAPAGGIVAAFATADDRLLLALRPKADQLAIYEWNAAGLRPILAQPLRSAGPIAVAADESDFYLAETGGGSLRIATIGAAERTVFERPGATPISVEWDWPSRRVRAVFEREDGHDLVSAALAGGTLPFHLSRQLPEGSREIAFDCSETGRFHILAADAERVHYLSNESEPKTVASGTAPFFPHVVCGEGVYLGWASPVNGYRFTRINSKDPLNFLVAYDRFPVL